MDYRPINTSAEELRLIAILPSGDDDQTQISALPSQEHDDLVHCTLEHYPLTQSYWKEKSLSRDLALALNWTTDASQDVGIAHADDSTNWRFHWGDFVALSYTWGSPADKKEIVVNQKTVQVQANLEAALRVLRAKKPMRSGYRIWVDALCINQADLAERSREVRRMRMIYRQAADVVIWLGTEAEDSNKAMDLIKILSNSCKDGTDKYLGAKLRRDPEHLGCGAWVALSRLLGRAYWSRMWIVQELCLGGSHAPILCGEKCVTWEELFSALYTFGKHNVDVIFACIDRERKAAGLASFGLNRNRIIHVNDEHQKQAGRAEPQYMPLLDLARSSDVTNPIDKVYGILGLMDPSVSSLITLNYTLSVEEVYKDFVQQYITGTNSLEILEQCRLQQESHMPSWVPDWRFRNHYRLHSGRHSSHHAGKDSAASYTFRVGGRILDVEGIILDAVDGLGQAYFQYNTSPIPEHGVLQPKDTAKAHDNETVIKDALWRTLTGDLTLPGQPAPDDYAEILDLPLREHYENPLPSRGARAFSRFLTQSGSLLISGRRLDTYFTNQSDKFPETKVDAVERIWRFTRTQRLMVLFSGRIGMAPNEAKQGDKVCVFLGSEVPVLLRFGETPGKPVKLVGSCYVPGFMAGEALQRVQDGFAKVETISLG